MLKPLILALALAAPAAASAQGAMALPCDGVLATFRTSAIKPGKMPVFQQAVADQSAWYASHPGGGTSKMMKVIRLDPKSHKASYATDEAMTLTTYPSAAAMRPQHDAAWDAFVAKFKDSSTIKSETRVCMPK